MGVDQVGCVSDDERVWVSRYRAVRLHFHASARTQLRAEALYHSRRAHTCGPNDVVTAQALTCAFHPLFVDCHDGRAETDVHSQPDELTERLLRQRWVEGWQ